MSIGSNHCRALVDLDRGARSERGGLFDVDVASSE